MHSCRQLRRIVLSIRLLCRRTVFLLTSKAAELFLLLTSKASPFKPGSHNCCSPIWPAAAMLLIMVGMLMIMVSVFHL